MSPSRRHALAVGIASLAAAGCGHWLRPTQRLADTLPKFDLETAFPKAFDGWVVDDRMPVQLVSPDQKAVLDQIYSQTLSRTYVSAEGQRIMLSVAYGGDQSDATRAHRPEVCYPAQGFQIKGDQSGSIQLADRAVRARQLVAVQGGRIEPITYWVMVGDRVAASGTEQKLHQLGYSTRGLIPDGMLVRISNISPDAELSYQLHRRFAQQLAGSLRAPELDRIFGAPRSSGAS
ncbi:EpsI family protein [Paucibacter sp. PLA-PC-4]|uniref:exosortase-associated protein EpsI, B-type n=1 Tax=Paucibacter sp. PLA-PC-4 TaxID=2993655 RepID=UPI00224A9D8B|nr:exosortase-associated protein EpsI, B-type [Paucibacter sp. PLA-PC-4]MCX2865280.1 EpsI family protein [Paucibacter sp. PLA-PC-4]